MIRVRIINCSMMSIASSHRILKTDMFIVPKMKEETTRNRIFLDMEILLAKKLKSTNMNMRPNIFTITEVKHSLL